MKKILLAFAILAAAIGAKAQGYAPQALPIPFVMTAGTTNLASPFVIDCRKQGRVSVAGYCSAGGVSGCTNELVWMPSIDGIYYDTNAADLLYSSNYCTVAANGGTNLTIQTITVPGSVGYLKCATIIVNGISSNNVATYGIKTGTTY